MIRLRFPIIASTVFLMVYALAPGLKVPDFWIYLAFTLSPFVVIWLVLHVLLLGEASGRSFDGGHWYDDHDINGVEEEGGKHC